MKLGRISKYYYLRLRRLRGSPHSLASGFAIGVFIGLTPTVPFHTIAIVFLTLITRTSTVAGVISGWIICNPFTYLPIYYFSLIVGNRVTPYEISWEKIQITLDSAINSGSYLRTLKILTGTGFEMGVVMLVGGCVFALPFTILSYYFALYFFAKMRKKRIEKRILH